MPHQICTEVQCVLNFILTVGLEVYMDEYGYEGLRKNTNGKTTFSYHLGNEMQKALRTESLGNADSKCNLNKKAMQGNFGCFSFSFVENF